MQACKTRVCIFLKEESLMLRSSIAGSLSIGDRFYPTSGLNPNSPVEECPTFFVLNIYRDQIVAIAETPVKRPRHCSLFSPNFRYKLSDYEIQLVRTGTIDTKIINLRLPLVSEYIAAIDYFKLRIEAPGELTGSRRSTYGYPLDTDRNPEQADPFLHIRPDNRIYDRFDDACSCRDVLVRPVLVLDAKTLVLVDKPESRLHVELSD